MNVCVTSAHNTVIDRCIELTPIERIQQFNLNVDVIIHSNRNKRIIFFVMHSDRSQIP